MKNFLVSTAILFSLAGCTAKPPVSSENSAPKTVQTDTGRIAFQRLYVTARSWASDAQPVTLKSQALPEANGHDGKAAVWNASFASDGKKRIKPWTWSGAVGKDEPSAGVSTDADDSYTPSNLSTRPFRVAFLKADSDKAYEVAQQHGGSALIEKNPNLPVTYDLSWDPGQEQLLWNVHYGASEGSLQVVVNAATGNFLRVER